VLDSCSLLMMLLVRPAAGSAFVAVAGATADAAAGTDVSAELAADAAAAGSVSAGLASGAGAGGALLHALRTKIRQKLTIDFMGRDAEGFDGRLPQAHARSHTRLNRARNALNWRRTTARRRGELMWASSCAVARG
jgi:hypothetical protein